MTGLRHSRLAPTLGLLLCLAAAPAAAEKSDQLRPTPSPVTDTGFVAGSFTLTPRLVYTRYNDSEPDPLIPSESIQYGMNSLGLAIAAGYTPSGWLSLLVGVEGYKKFGTISSISMVDNLTRSTIDADGSAFKLMLGVNLQVWRTGAELPEPRLGDHAVYLFARGIGDLFQQDQIDPLGYTVEFNEKSFEYRVGAAAHVHLVSGVYLAAFGGLDGIVFTGQMDYGTTGTALTRLDRDGGEGPYPFFGFDIMFAPLFIGARPDETISLGALWALTPEDEAGYGGAIYSLNLGYTWKLNVP